MTRGAREAHASTVLQPGSAVSWRVGPVDAPDTLRTGVMLRRDPDPAWVWVRPTDELGERRMRLADLDGPWRQGPRPRAIPPERGPALDLPAPVAHTLELLALLDKGVEIQPGQRTVLAPVLEQLVQRDYIVRRDGGRWELTEKGMEVLHG